MKVLAQVSCKLLRITSECENGRDMSRTVPYFTNIAQKDYSPIVKELNIVSNLPSLTVVLLNYESTSPESQERSTYSQMFTSVQMQR